jgi:hypothetical protein
MKILYWILGIIGFIGVGLWLASLIAANGISNYISNSGNINNTNVNTDSTLNPNTGLPNVTNTDPLLVS